MVLAGFSEAVLAGSGEPGSCPDSSVVEKQRGPASLSALGPFCIKRILLVPKSIWISRETLLDFSPKNFLHPYFIATIM